MHVLKRKIMMKINWKQTAGRVWKDVKEYKWLGIVLIAYYLLVEYIFSAFCPLVIITGFPCPGCGITRAFLCVLTGQFARAWNINPLIYGVLLTALYAGIQRYLLGRRVKGFYQLLCILAVLMIVVYIYRMYRYFPHRSPMSITRGSLLEEILPGYREFLNKLQRW